MNASSRSTTALWAAPFRASRRSEEVGCWRTPHFNDERVDGSLHGSCGVAVWLIVDSAPLIDQVRLAGAAETGTATGSADDMREGGSTGVRYLATDPAVHRLDDEPGLLLLWFRMFIAVLLIGLCVVVTRSMRRRTTRQSRLVITTAA